jgi:hypothetical protein
MSYVFWGYDCKYGDWPSDMGVWEWLEKYSRYAYMACHEPKTSVLSLDYQVSTHVHVVHCLPVYECNNPYTTLQYVSLTSSRVKREAAVEVRHRLALSGSATSRIMEWHAWRRGWRISVSTEEPVHICIWRRWGLSVPKRLHAAGTDKKSYTSFPFNIKCDRLHWNQGRKRET